MNLNVVRRYSYMFSLCFEFPNIIKTGDLHGYIDAFTSVKSFSIKNIIRKYSSGV